MQKHSAAAAAERARFAAIAALPEARGNEDRALKLATTTDLSVDQIKSVLAAETTGMWDAALASRGMKLGARTPGPDATARDLWDETLRRRGLAVGV